MQRLLAIAFACSALCMIAATAQAAERECRPSLSNLWHCPGVGETQQRTKPVEKRACRPSLSNGYHCPGPAAPSSSTSSNSAN